MTKTVMTARVTDQHLTLVNVPLIASGGVDEVRINFQFCGLWDGCGKTAVFYRDPEEVYHVPIAGGSAIVPHEVLTEEGYFYLGVMGAADNIRTTEVVQLYVAQGAITTPTANHKEPTPDVYHQLLALYEKLVAMRGTEGIKQYDFSSGPIRGRILSNGINAWIRVSISDLTIEAGGGHFTEECIPFEFVSLEGSLILEDSPNLQVYVTFSEDPRPGGGGIEIYNLANEAYHFRNTNYEEFYPLQFPCIPEIVDARVDNEGNVHPTAGAAVRAIGAKVAGAAHGVVEALCPEFSAKGKRVRCEPVKDYPIKVRSYFAPPTYPDGSYYPHDEFEITLTLAGKNIYNPAAYPLTVGRYVLSTGKLTNYNNSSNYACTEGFIYVGHLKGQQITLNHPPAEVGGSNPKMNFYEHADESTVISNSSTNAHTATVPDNALYMRFSVPKIYADGSQIQIELGTMVTAYEAYREPIEVTATPYYAGTDFYRGYFDWHTGELYSTHDLKDAKLVEKEAPVLVATIDPKTITPGGSSIIYSDMGDTEVSGRANPGALIDILTRRLDSIASMAVAGGMAL